jgi:hypothetical protein
MYNGDSVRYNGNDIKKDRYGSIELPFGNFYKAQIEPLIEEKYGITPFFAPNKTINFKYIDGGPYF